MTTEQAEKLFQTKPKLLAVLQMGGARSQVFTAKQVIFFLGKYIEKQKLFDPSNKYNIRCKSDLLGEVLQVDSFTVSDFGNIWKLVCPNLLPAPKETPTPKEKEQGECSTGELPWWHNASRPNRENDNDTDAESYAEKETVIAHDTDYGSDSEVEHEEYEPVSSNSEGYSDAEEPLTSEDESPNILSLLPFQSDTEEETAKTDSGINSNIKLETNWSCHECGTLNSPALGHCERCWVRRKTWLNDPLAPNPGPLPGPSTTPHRKTHDASDPDKLDPDVPDCANSTLSTVPGPSGINPISPLGKRKPQCAAPSEPCAKKTRLDLDCDVIKPEEAPSGANTENDLPGLCNICHSKPNDATMVHGKIGHQFCCYNCAKRLRRRGKGCPVCRQPIVLIIRNFIVQI